MSFECGDLVVMSSGLDQGLVWVVATTHYTGRGTGEQYANLRLLLVEQAPLTQAKEETSQAWFDGLEPANPLLVIASAAQ